MGTDLWLFYYGLGFILFCFLSGSLDVTFSAYAGNAAGRYSDFSHCWIYFSAFPGFCDLQFVVSGAWQWPLQPDRNYVQAVGDQDSAGLFSGSVWRYGSYLVLLADFGSMLYSNQHILFFKDI